MTGNASFLALVLSGVFGPGIEAPYEVTHLLSVYSPTEWGVDTSDILISRKVSSGEFSIAFMGPTRGWSQTVTISIPAGSGQRLIVTEWLQAQTFGEALVSMSMTWEPLEVVFRRGCHTIFLEGWSPNGREGGRAG